MLDPLCQDSTGASARSRPEHPQPKVTAAWCRRSAQEAGLASRFFRRSDATGFAWCSKQPLGSVNEVGEGLNSGAAGIILGLLSIDQACRTSTFREDVQGGAQWLASRPPMEEAHGLFTGNAGVALALAVAGKRLRREDLVEAAQVRFLAAAGMRGDFDLFSGLSGVLWAACQLGGILESQEPIELADPCGAALVARAEMLNGIPVWPCFDPQDPPLTGAAHGSAGIALALAAWSKRANRSDATELAHETFVRLFEHGRAENDRTLLRTIAGSPAPVPTWCHGVAGYLWCILLAFGDDPRFERQIDWSVERLAATEVIGSPVQCHGMAGELELWRMLSGVPRFARLARQRMSRAASALRLQLQRRAGLCVWGAENPDVVTPDLWVGFLGPAAALALHACGRTDALLSDSWLRACSRKP